MPRLDWIPNKLKAPRHLRDFQRSWFTELRDAMFENAEMQGYLPKTGDLWRVAGAHDRAFFERNCAAVMACFNSRHLNDDQEVIFYPPLLDLIDSQREKLRGNRRARESPSNSFSQSAFDFEVQKQNQSESVPAKPVQSAPTCRSCKGTGIITAFWSARIVQRADSQRLGRKVPLSECKPRTVERFCECPMGQQKELESA